MTQKNKNAPDISLQKPCFIYDGECGFCRRWVAYSKRVTGERVQYEPYQKVGDMFPDISEEAFRNAVKLIKPDGAVTSGAAATFETLAYNPKRTTLWWLYRHVPGFSTVSEWFYTLISHHRDAALKVTEFFFGTSRV